MPERRRQNETLDDRAKVHDRPPAPHVDERLVHVANVGEEFEQRFIELLVIMLVDETRIRLSDRILEYARP